MFSLIFAEFDAPSFVFGVLLSAALLAWVQLVLTLIRLGAAPETTKKPEQNEGTPPAGSTVDQSTWMPAFSPDWWNRRWEAPIDGTEEVPPHLGEHPWANYRPKYANVTKDEILESVRLIDAETA